MTDAATASHPNETAEIRTSDQRLQALLQLYIAEYQALTTRNTYWITLQYALWPILILSLALLAQVPSLLPKQVLAWSAAVIVQVIVVAYYGAAYETYNNVRYIEHELRPLVRAIVGGSPFWNYERYLKQRRALAPAWWEYGPIILSVGAPSIVGWARLPWSVSDYVWFAATLIGVILSASLARTIVRTREDFFPTG